MISKKEIEYLNSYTMSNDKIELVLDVVEMFKLTIPQYWKEAFIEMSLESKKDIILGEWKKYVGIELSNTIAYLSDFLQDISLIKIGAEYSILYSIQSYRSQKTLYYIGKNPVDSSKGMNDTIGEKWNLIDTSITNFYSHIHNGFSVFESRSMGLDAVNNIESMNEYDWEYEEQLVMDTSLVFNFFSNGQGQYITLDITKSLKNGAFLWSNKTLPKGNLNFWDVIDEWLVIGFDI